MTPSPHSPLCCVKKNGGGVGGSVMPGTTIKLLVHKIVGNRLPAYPWQVRSLFLFMPLPPPQSKRRTRRERNDAVVDREGHHHHAERLVDAADHGAPGEVRTYLFLAHARHRGDHGKTPALEYDGDSNGASLRISCRVGQGGDGEYMGILDSRIPTPRTNNISGCDIFCKKQYNIVLTVETCVMLTSLRHPTSSSI